MLKRARAGDIGAAKVLLTYVVGRLPDTADRLDEDEKKHRRLERKQTNSSPSRPMTERESKALGSFFDAQREAEAVWQKTYEELLSRPGWSSPPTGA